MILDKDFLSKDGDNTPILKLFGTKRSLQTFEMSF